MLLHDGCCNINDRHFLKIPADTSFIIRHFDMYECSVYVCVYVNLTTACCQEAYISEGDELTHLKMVWSHLTLNVDFKCNSSTVDTKAFSCHNKHISGHVSLVTTKSSLVTESQCVLNASWGTFTSPRVHFNAKFEQGYRCKNSLFSNIAERRVNHNGVCFSGVMRSWLDQSIKLDIISYV